MKYIIDLDIEFGSKFQKETIEVFLLLGIATIAKETKSRHKKNKVNIVNFIGFSEKAMAEYKKYFPGGVV